MNGKILKPRKRKRIPRGEDLIKTTDEPIQKNFDLGEIYKSYEKKKKIKTIITDNPILENSVSEITDEFNSQSFMHYSYSIQKEKKESCDKSESSYERLSRIFGLDSSLSRTPSRSLYLSQSVEQENLDNQNLEQITIDDKELKKIHLFNEDDDEDQQEQVTENNFSKKQPRLSFHLTMSKQESEKILHNPHKRDIFQEEKEKLSKSFSIQNESCNEMFHSIEYSGKKNFKDKLKILEDLNFQQLNINSNFIEINKSMKNSQSNKHNFTRNQEVNYNINLDKIYEEQKTTLFIKNIPNKYTKKMMMEEFDKKFKDSYDFFYLPIDFNNNCNMGFAFINFIDIKFIKPFFNELSGKKWKRFKSLKVCEIKYARIQGRDKCLVHFNKSTLMKQNDSKVKPYLKAEDTFK
jgi:hypothetical protein